METPTAPKVDIRPAPATEHTAIAHLLQLYAHDFSEFARPGSTDFDFGPDGKFPPYPQLDAYWSDPARWPVLIHADGKLVGFALINTVAHSGGQVDRNMGEFFIARRWRRRGVASEAVRQIVARYPGLWEIAVAERNTGALAFWPRAIASASTVADITVLQGDGKLWRGPIWRFRAA